MSTVDRRGRHLGTAVGAVLTVAAVIALLVGFRAQQHAPTPPPSAAGSIADSPSPGSPAPSGSPASSGGGPAPASQTRGPILAASAPIRLQIPAIGVSSVIRPLGLNADGTVQVPPLSKDSYPGWYKYSPTPGQLGPSLILGHIDSARYGPGVFFKLGALRPGDTVSMTRADNTVAVFKIERVAQYPKAHFPTLEVYGNTDHAALRLITCGGKFDLSAHSYEDNIVAYASLLSSHPV